MYVSGKLVWRQSALFQVWVRLLLSNRLIGQVLRTKMTILLHFCSKSRRSPSTIGKIYEIKFDLRMPCAMWCTRTYIWCANSAKVVHFPSKNGSYNMERSTRYIVTWSIQWCCASNVSLSHNIIYFHVFSINMSYLSCSMADISLVKSCPSLIVLRSSSKPFGPWKRSERILTSKSAYTFRDQC